MQKYVKTGKGVLPETVLVFQRSELTEHYIYKQLAERAESLKNRRVLSQIAEDELRHHDIWKTYTRQDVRPDWIRIRFFTAVCALFGLTFGVKLMEKTERNACDAYRQLPSSFGEAKRMLRDEEEHETVLISLLDEERLKYTGSVVLGLNDALVELMGVLAGLAFALQDSRFVALTGIITGFAAALSMAASEYLSTKAEQQSKSPTRAALYTGAAYIATVVMLITPFLLIPSLYAALATAFLASVCIIGVFNFYVSVAQDVPFRSRFFEMVGLSFGVAALSFLAGMVVRIMFDVS